MRKRLRRFKKHKAFKPLNFFVAFGIGLVFFIGLILATNASPLNTILSVLNIAPSFSSPVYISQSAFSLHDDYLTKIEAPSAGNTKTLHINGVIEDKNGANDLAGVKIVFYRSGVVGGENCTANANSCYIVDNCFINPYTEIDKKYNCQINLACSIDQTFPDGQFQAQDWRISATVFDKSGASGKATTTPREVQRYPEVCDGMDNNCNGSVDEGVTRTFYQDKDEDGYGNSLINVNACAQPIGYVLDSSDCNDNDNANNPGAHDICDARNVVINKNCNAFDDSQLNCANFCLDQDSDGFTPDKSKYQSLQKYVCMLKQDGDCDDNNQKIYPGAQELCDNKDNDCDGKTDEGASHAYYQDKDKDGYGNPNVIVNTCTPAVGYVSNNSDCNDDDNKVNPAGHDVCDAHNGVINKDCNTSNDSKLNCAGICLDPDSDGFVVDVSKYQESEKDICASKQSGDCDNNNGTIYPGAQELCDTKDNNCNGQIDEDIIKKYYQDKDGDGYGNQNILINTCSPSAGYVLNKDDCNDDDALINPDANDICSTHNNAINRNCNVEDDNKLHCADICLDPDADGFVIDKSQYEGNTQIICMLKQDGDCKEGDSAVYPGAPEICDSKDNDCNGQADENAKLLTCGAGVCQTQIDSCQDGVAQTCVPLPAPEKQETTCNDGLDNDCDGYIDQKDNDCLDSDGDGVKNADDFCPNTPGLGGASEYTLDILNFKSTWPGVAKPRVFLGEQEIFPDKQNQYHVSLRDDHNQYFVDKVNYSRVPIGAWLIERPAPGMIVSGILGDPQKIKSKEYVYYKTKSSLNSGYSLSAPIDRDLFENPYDNKFTIGNDDQDRISANKNFIFTDGTIQSGSDFYQLNYDNLRGCPFGDMATVYLHVLDLNKSGECDSLSGGIFNNNSSTSCVKPLGGVEVKIYDTKNNNFVTAYGSGRPSREHFDDIYKDSTGLVGSCITNDSGHCLAPEKYAGDFLMIARIYDKEQGLAVYQGRHKNFFTKSNRLFEEEDDDDDDNSQNQVNLATQVKGKNLRFMKVIYPGGFVDYKASRSHVIIGSVLHVEQPEFSIIRAGRELYPFIFSSRDVWSANICLDMPVGFNLVSVMDKDGNIVDAKKCTDILINSEKKVVFFESNTDASATGQIDTIINLHHTDNLKNKDVKATIKSKLQRVSLQSSGVIEGSIKQETLDLLEAQKIKSQDIIIYRLSYLIPLLTLLVILLTIYLWWREQKIYKRQLEEIRKEKYDSIIVTSSKK